MPAAPGAAAGLPVPDVLTGERFQWRIGRNYVGFEPGIRQAHVFAGGE